MTVCGCVATHSPTCRTTHAHHIWPLGMGGPDTADNIVHVCPNTHASAHQLLRLTGYRYDGDTPWWVRRQFPTLARDLAWDGWQTWDEAGRPVDRQRWIYQGSRVAVASSYTLVVAVMRRSAHDRNALRAELDAAQDALGRATAALDAAGIPIPPRPLVDILADFTDRE